MRILLTISLLLVCQFYRSISYSQTEFSRPLTGYFPDSAAIVDAWKSRHSAATADMKKKSELLGMYDERHERLLIEFDRHFFHYDADLYRYFDFILGEICNANPGIDRHSLRLLIGRHPWPNARSLGEGTLVFHFDLFRRLENESQVAFVLCHEIAHFSLDHTNLAMRAFDENWNSKETKARIRELKKQEYNTKPEALKLFRGLVFDQRRHSRGNEFQADSLAMIYLANTGYDPREAVRCLEILDAVDGPKYNWEFPIDSVFNASGYPFKRRWLSAGYSPFDHQKRASLLNEDSLKTHPECAARVNAVRRIGVGNSGKAFLQTEAEFRRWLAQADVEHVASNYFFGDYGAALYQALQLLRRRPGDPYLTGLAGLCFFRLQEARANHDAGKHLQRASIYREPHYNRFLTFMNELRMSEMGKVGYHFLLKYESEGKSHDLFAAALTLLASAVDETRFPELKKYYLHSFPEGKFKSTIENL